MSNIDKRFKALSKTCNKASKAIKDKVDKYEDRKKILKKQRDNKKVLEAYKDIPLVRAVLNGTSIEQAANEIRIEESKKENSID